MIITPLIKVVSDKNGKLSIRRTDKTIDVEALVKSRVITRAEALSVKQILKPGTELKKIFASLGITNFKGCNCNSRIAQMNDWGVEGCERNRNQIIKWLESDAPKFGLTTKLKAASLVVVRGLAFKIDWSNPIPGLVDEAINRAKASSVSHLPDR